MNRKNRKPWEFRDQVVPARVFHLLRIGVITSKDLLLLAVINAMTKSQNATAGRGCFATNDYLAKASNINKTTVSEKLGLLKSMGLLLIIYFKSTRYLEVEWSRIAEERQALEGTYGKRFRRAYKELQNRLAKLESKDFLGLYGRKLRKAIDDQAGEPESR